MCVCVCVCCDLKIKFLCVGVGRSLLRTLLLRMQSLTMPLDYGQLQLRTLTSLIRYPHSSPPPPSFTSAMPQGRVLVCADGSTSKLATQLGLVTGPPQATCSRSYVGAGTHSFKADGVMFYPRGILPGKLKCMCCVPYMGTVVIL